MNIFFLDVRPDKAAEYHCDKHVTKMPQETGAIFCINIWYLEPDRALAMQLPWNPSRRAKPAWTDHKSVKWARQSTANWYWLHDFFLCLLAEYTHRYGRRHDYEPLYDLVEEPPTGISDSSSFTQPALAMPQRFWSKDHVISYRHYYINDKRTFAVWNRGRSAPFWWPHDWVYCGWGHPYLLPLPIISLGYRGRPLCCPSGRQCPFADPSGYRGLTPRPATFVWYWGD